MINLSLNELKLIAKLKSIKDYKKIWRQFHKNTQWTKTKNYLSKKKIKKSKINKFRRSLYNIKTKKNLSTSEIKETEKNLELEKSLYNLKGRLSAWMT